jgi:signal transduction histidine kinase
MLFAIHRDLARRGDLEKALLERTAFQEQFLGILGHDLRNPLSAVSMATNLLHSAGALNDKQAHSVRMISSSAARMLRMVDQLLDLTRARAGGGLPIEPKPATDLSEIARGVVEELRIASAEHGILIALLSRHVLARRWPENSDGAHPGCQPDGLGADVLQADGLATDGPEPGVELV